MSMLKPSIQWLLPFEAAARHLSFKLAAEELHVTPPAISQQIKALEHHLDLLLFERRTRSLVLTPAGTEFYKTASRVIEVYDNGCQALYRQFRQRAFYMATEPYIAHTLLIPNLMSFKDVLPGTELRVETRLSMAGVSLEDIDAGIRFGSGDWDGMQSFALTDVVMAPVGNPQYFTEKPARVLSDLKRHCFFYPNSQEKVIGPFLAQLEKAGIVPAEIIPCESYLDAMTAASEGLGVTVAILPYANRWINEGKLMIPFDVTWNTSAKFWVVFRKEYADLDKMGAVCKWLESIVSELPALDSIKV
ncbi:hypothetical protein A9Q99_27690 [Gammaproteobacteria bacterium 45_16_T64]|nr:hypothetical protein A9Q99_27690 [Gammaproteobacteria bacterium 45_16_T64]